MAQNSNIVLIGMPGSGKTTIGLLLAEKLDYEFIDVDEVIEATFGTIDSLFKKGEDYFRQCETHCTELVAEQNKKVIATGGGVVTREENIKALKETGKIFFLNRSVDNIIKDIVSETRPLLADGVEKLYTLYNQRIELYNKYADVIIDSDCSIEDVINKIISNIKEQ